MKFNYFIPYLNIDFTSWRLLTVVFAIPSALGAIGVYLSYESPRFLLTVGKEEEALEILRGIFTINTGKSGDDYNASIENLNVSYFYFYINTQCTSVRL